MFGVGPLEMLLALFLLAALAFVAAVVIRWALSGVHDTPGTEQTVRDNDDSAEEILNKRYAGGELTREEYLDIRSDTTREQNA
ncbi:MAG: hypothetical protein WKF44_05330 [Rubrobacteraceae bacterium]